MRIPLQPYDPFWPILFEAERSAILEAVGELPIRIEHIGSTAVPGLSAKPVIDVLAGIPDLTGATAYVEAMEAGGFTYLPDYEDTMPFRRLFIGDDGEGRRANIHMVAVDTPFWGRHLAFRDHLRSHPEERDRYQALKLELAARDWDHVNDYAAAKNDFIMDVEARLGFRPEDRNG